MALRGEVVINTGNVVNLVDIKKKAGQNVTEELNESVQITIDDWKRNGLGNNNKGGKITNVSRPNDDSKAKMAEEERKDLKVGVKIFVRSADPAFLVDCLENVYSTLDIESIENVILAYCPENEKLSNGNENSGENADTEKVKCDILPSLKVLWNVLEKYVKQGRISQVGVSDLEEACFKKLHEESEIRPSIIQINLASCCVVPPGLQTFCKENDIQLLTHSDPNVIVERDTLNDILKAEVNVLKWCVRYQVHIKCRGVLALKGYMLGMIMKQP